MKTNFWTQQKCISIIHKCSFRKNIVGRSLVRFNKQVGDFLFVPTKQSRRFVRSNKPELLFVPAEQTWAIIFARSNQTRAGDS